MDGRARSTRGYMLFSLCTVLLAGMTFIVFFGDGRPSSFILRFVALPLHGGLDTREEACYRNFT
jgi:hypothetical protein